MKEAAQKIEILPARPKYLWIAGSIFILALTLTPLWAGRGVLRAGTEIFSYLTLAMLWNLLAGYAGMMSIGQQAYVGIGGYALYALCGLAGWSPLAGVAIAGISASLFAWCASFVLFRLQGAYLAIASWVVAEIVMLGISQCPLVGAGAGMSLPADVARSIAPSPVTRAGILWWASLAFALAVVLGSWRYLRSRHGLALTALRDNESAASTLGVNARRNKLRVHLFAAFAAGCVGALVFLGKARISPGSAFDVQEWTASIIFIVVIGGIGSLEGPIIGTLIYFALRGLFADFGAWYLMLLGAVAVAFMLFAPSGVWGLIKAWGSPDLLPTQRLLNLSELAVTRRSAQAERDPTA